MGLYGTRSHTAVARICVLYCSFDDCLARTSLFTIMLCLHFHPFPLPCFPQGERIGALTIVSETPAEAKAVESQIKILIRYGVVWYIYVCLFVCLLLLGEGGIYPFAKIFTVNECLWGPGCPPCLLVSICSLSYSLLHLLVIFFLFLFVSPMYSNPPIHGARIVSRVLGDEKLRKEW